MRNLIASYLHKFSCRFLLSLPHGQLVQFLHSGLCDGLDLWRGIGSRGQETDERNAVVGLLQHRLQIQDGALQVLCSQRVEDVFAGLKKGRWYVKL